MFLKKKMSGFTGDYSDKAAELKEKISEADAVVIGAGSGLSTSAGFVYSGERFKQYFSDFEEKYDFHDMYSGGFYPYDTLEEYWAYWSRYIYINRYMDEPKPVYDRLLELVRDKDYFVITTNVDHCFQKAGFDKKRLFYTQGDYGLFQCSEPCCQETYDNEETVRKMVLSQGYEIAEDGSLITPQGNEALTGKSPAMAQKNESAMNGGSDSEKKLLRIVPSDLVPACPHCGRPLTMNLRADATFVEDEGWHRAAERYEDFLRARKNMKVLFLELGVGYNTPGIIKYSFWQMTARNPKAVYACLNYDEAFAPDEIKKQSVCIGGDIGEALLLLRE